jgi:ParB/RepB/Spo0J family partition protein
MSQQNVVPVRLAGNEELWIPIDEIVESTYLPRKTFEEESINELGEDIAKSGLIHPILVCRLPEGKYGLQAGSRRLRSARKAGFTHIPAKVTDESSPREMVIRALAENVQRRDLEPLEEAATYLWLYTEFGMKLNDIAASLHKSLTYVQNRFKVLDTAPEVQQLIADGKLPFKVGVLIANVPEGEEQVAIAHEAVRNRLTPDDVRNRIREGGKGLVGAKPNYARSTLTVNKYRLSVIHMRQKLERWFAAVQKLAATKEERQALMKVHLELEEFSKRCRDRITIADRERSHLSSSTKALQGNVPTARNHGQEWTVGQVKLLEDKDLSDEVIAERTGRTVKAVQGMRSTIKRMRQ